ncbi:MAG: AraC family transcriptional regulator [Pseudomonadota bacterium]
MPRASTPARPRATTPARYVLILIDMVESKGCSRNALLAGTSLAESGLANIGARVRDKDFATLTDNALKLTGDPALGLELGLHLNLSAHAVLGQAFMTCRDLGQVIDLFFKYYHLLAPAMHLEYEVVEGSCVLTIVDSASDLPLEFTFELLGAGMLNTLRGLLNTQDLQLTLEAPYPAPAHADRYYEVFGQNVRFDCISARISFDEALLHTPLPLSNNALRQLYEDECARLLADMQEETSIAEQTLQLMRKFEGQYPQMPQIATMLNLSPRTFRRRLEEEQHSYQQLLDQVRAEHATRYLQNTRLPISNIAYLIGFNDASNFRRAYQRWTGKSPADVRNDA